MTGEDARISLRRTGGLAGLPMEATLDTRDMTAEEAQQIVRALDSVDIASLGTGRDWPPGAADTFHYDLEIHRGEATHTASFSDRQVPTELSPVVRALMNRAKPARRRG